MPRRYIEHEPLPDLTEDQLEGLKLEEEIILKVGDNRTKEKFLHNDLDLVEEDGSKTKSNCFYTYRGQVCILDDQGMDVNFGCYKLRTQKKIHTEIIAGRYK